MTRCGREPAAGEKRGLQMSEPTAKKHERLALAFAFRPSAAAGVFSAASLRRLGELCEVVADEPLQSLDDSHGRAVMAKVEVLVTCWGCPRIDAAVLAQAPHLKLVAHAAGTIKSFIGAEAFERGVTVVNAASANAMPVAEFTLAAILFANKRVLAFRDLYRARREMTPWGELSDPSVGNWRKTIGVVGASRIGRRVIELLQPFGFDVLLYDPHVGKTGLAAHQVGLDELMRAADVVTLHAPALDSTAGMINARRLSSMKDGATLINTARGSLVDQVALERELISGRLSAVIDVTVPEVLARTSPLYDLPNVLLTPHIAGALGSERERLGALVVDEVARFVTGKPLLHALSAATLHLQA